MKEVYDESWMCKGCGEVYDIPSSESDEYSCPVCGSTSVEYIQVINRD